tara:strand:+ start:1169 stop:1852 length:684 start_codon:yes stop_codon:yes gene_type:complete
MTKHMKLSQQLQLEFSNIILSSQVSFDEVTIECGTEHIHFLLTQLRDIKQFDFNQLIDICAVDYLKYGVYDWETEQASESGFSRGVERQEKNAWDLDKPRFAVVYHLLSTTLNHRLRVKVFIAEDKAIVPSAHDIWKAANWFEREAYDLFGILFEGHPDLRRILTDYGFVGHPFRKDFPLSGHVEMRYDAKLKKVIYEPVDIEPRIGVPKVIREDNRYAKFSRGKHD